MTIVYTVNSIKRNATEIYSEHTHGNDSQKKCNNELFHTAHSSKVSKYYNYYKFVNIKNFREFVFAKLKDYKKQPPRKNFKLVFKITIGNFSKTTHITVKLALRVHVASMKI